MDTNMQLTINSFRPLFPDKIFFDISLTFSKIPDSYQIPGHVQVFQTSGHPVFHSNHIARSRRGRPRPIRF